jgi:hypothetical protein
MLYVMKGMRGSQHDYQHDHDRAHGHDHGHEHGHGHGGERHDGHGVHGRGRDRWPGTGLARRLPHVARPHSHEAAGKVDAAMEASSAGMRALWLSLGVLGATAVIQAVVAALSGSVAPGEPEGDPSAAGVTGNTQGKDYPRWQRTRHPGRERR